MFKLKIHVYESCSETMGLKARVTIGLTANDAKNECIVYHGDNKGPSFEEVKELCQYGRIQVFEKRISTELVRPGSSYRQEPIPEIDTNPFREFVDQRIKSPVINFRNHTIIQFSNSTSTFRTKQVRPKTNATK